MTERRKAKTILWVWWMFILSAATMMLVFANVVLAVLVWSDSVPVSVSLKIVASIASAINATACACFLSWLLDRKEPA